MSLRLVSFLAILGCAVAATLRTDESTEAKVLLDHHTDVHSEFVHPSAALDNLMCLVTDPDQSFVVGHLERSRKLLMNKILEKPATDNTVNTEYLDWWQDKIDIHAIEVVDMIQNGKNAVVTLESGGYNQNHVIIKFKSQIGEKIYYTVKIWGNRKTSVKKKLC